MTTVREMRNPPPPPKKKTRVAHTIDMAVLLSWPWNVRGAVGPGGFRSVKTTAKIGRRPNDDADEAVLVRDCAATESKLVLEKTSFTS